MKRGLSLLAALAALALPSAASSDLNTGPQTILAILVTWGPQPFTTAELRTTLFDQANAYVKDVSFGEASLAGDVTPWLTVKQYGDCDPVTISDMELAALNAAKAAGFDPTKYSRHFFAFPRPPACPFAGFGAGSEVWLFGTDSARVIQHELGHTFGFGHAWSIACPTCKPVEYGDPYDEMGHGPGHYNASEKAAAGWLTNLTVASANGDYTIDQLEQKSTLPQALVVHTAVNDYWFDHREPLLEDAVFAGSQIVQGAEVHASPSPDDRNGMSPYLPGNVLILNPVGAGGDAIRPGETFSQPGAFSLTVLDRVGTHVDVRFRWTDEKPPGRPAVFSPLGLVRTPRLDIEWGRGAETGSGLASYAVLLDGKLRKILPADAPRQLLLPKPKRGRHVVAVVAVDRAGNRSRPGLSTITVR